MPTGHKLQNRPRLVADAGLMYQGGMTVRDIARELGISYGAAHNLVRESGQTFRPRSTRRAVA